MALKKKNQALLRLQPIREIWTMCGVCECTQHLGADIIAWEGSRNKKWTSTINELSSVSLTNISFFLSVWQQPWPGRWQRWRQGRAWRQKTPAWSPPSCPASDCWWPLNLPASIAGRVCRSAALYSTVDCHHSGASEPWEPGDRDCIIESIRHIMEKAPQPNWTRL